MREEARHDDVIVTADDAGDVLRRLSLAQLDGVWTQVDRVAAQPVEALRRSNDVRACDS